MITKFPENLRKALELNKMSQQDLALKLHTTQATVCRWGKGMNEPDYQTFLEICLCLNETPNFLLGYDEISTIDNQQNKNQRRKRT